MKSAMNKSIKACEYIQVPFSSTNIALASNAWPTCIGLALTKLSLLLQFCQLGLLRKDFISTLLHFEYAIVPFRDEPVCWTLSRTDWDRGSGRKQIWVNRSCPMMLYFKRCLLVRAPSSEGSRTGSKLLKITR